MTEPTPIPGVVCTPAKFSPHVIAWAAIVLAWVAIFLSIILADKARQRCEATLDEVRILSAYVYSQPAVETDGARTTVTRKVK
jgi:hypothetical protein